MSPLDVLLLNAAASWALVGLIWNVQLVQYPSFARVGPREFSTFHEHHCARIVRIVAPLMGLELLTGLALLQEAPAALSPGFGVAGLSLIAVNWIVTAALFVPLHGRLGRREEATQRALVHANWLRTAAWSARGVWALVALRLAIPS